MLLAFAYLIMAGYRTWDGVPKVLRTGVAKELINFECGHLVPDEIHEQLRKEGW